MCFGAAQLKRERSGAGVALRANLKGDAAIGEKVHEGGIIYSGDAVADSFCAEEFDGFPDFFGAADFSGVD